MKVKLFNRSLKILNFLIPVTLAFIVSSIFALIAKKDPFTVFSIIFKSAFTTQAGWMNTIGYAAPLIMTGIATTFSISAGVFNMGIEGQVQIGAIFSAVVATMQGVPKAIHIPLCILAGMVGGILYSLIPALLKAKLKINEVVTTIMLNNVAITLTNYLTNGPFNANYAYSSTPNIEETAKLTRLFPKYKVTTSIFIALVLLIIVYIILKKTCFGYEISFIGKQKEFADAAGMRVSKKIIIIFVLGGAIAGIAGATEIMGVHHAFLPGWGGSPGIGWDGFSVCVLAALNPIGVLIVSIIYGGFHYGCIALQAKTGTPVELLSIVKSAIILFYSIKYIKDTTDGKKILEKIKSFKLFRPKEEVAK